jgi:hypothetical protein
MKIDQLFESGDDLASQFAQMAKEKGMNVRVRGTPDQERQRTQDMLAQRRSDQEKQSQLAGEKDFANLDQLEAEYAKMKDEYQSLGGSNWQYADREQNLSASERKARSMEDGLRALWSRIQRAKKQGMAEGSREMTGTARDRFISTMTPRMDNNALMQKVGKVVNSPEFNSDTILKIVDSPNITHPVGRYIQKEFDELQYDLGRAYEDHPEEVAEKLLSMLIDRTQQGMAEGSREMTGTARDRFISTMTPRMDNNALMQKVGKVVNSPEFNSDTILKIVDAGDTITHPVGRYIQKEFDELQYDLGRAYEDHPERVAEKLLSMLQDRTHQGVAEGHPDEKEDKALIRKMVKQQALKKENMLAREQHEDHEISMATSELKNVYINAKKLFDIIKQRSEQEGLDAWQQSKITKASDYLNSVLTAIRGEPRR